jgi:putative transcriptional regulator
MIFEESENNACLKGSLILADPSLRDPNFFRSVLLLTEHRLDQGAHGYILNRPMNKLVGDVLSSSEFAPLRQVPIFIGGPVGQEHLTFAAFEWKQDQKILDFATHLDTEDAIRRHRSGQEVRAFLGYSGWEEGQLEEELRQKAWITRKPAGSALKRDSTEKIWSELLSSMGPWYQLLSKAPENLYLN